MSNRNRGGLRSRMKSDDDASPKRRLRGVILRLIYDSRERHRKGRYDEAMLLAALDALKFDVSSGELRAALVRLAERDYVRFEREKDGDTGRIALRRIEITPEGRDVAYRIKTDPAVEIE